MAWHSGLYHCFSLQGSAVQIPLEAFLSILFFVFINDCVLSNKQSKIKPIGCQKKILKAEKGGKRGKERMQRRSNFYFALAIMYSCGTKPVRPLAHS